MNPQEYIQTYGGKAGGWFFLKEKGEFGLSLLPNYFIQPGQDSVKVLSQIPKSDLVDNWAVMLLIVYQVTCLQRLFF